MGRSGLKPNLDNPERQSLFQLVGITAKIPKKNAPIAMHCLPNAISETKSSGMLLFKNMQFVKSLF